MGKPVVPEQTLPALLAQVSPKDARLLATGALFAIVLMFLFSQPRVSFVYDAVGYWDLGKSFFVSGHFNFLDFDTNIPRGYFFPLLLGILRIASSAVGFDDQSAFLIVSALCFAVFCGAIVPTLYTKVNDKSPTLLQISIFAALFFYFWNGFLFHPLTDLPALYFSVLGCLLLLFFERPGQFPIALASYACLTAATATRPAYLATLLAVSIAIIYFKNLWRSPKHLAIMLISATTMIALLWIPQLYLNQVKPSKVESDARKLHEFQLSFGIAWEKYETTTGNDLGGKPQVVYWNPLGTKIYQTEHLIAPFNFSIWRRVVRKYPMEVLTIYGKHLFNGFDLQFSEPYPRKIFANHVLFSFLNYCLLFFSVTYIAGIQNFVNYRRQAVLYLSLLSPIALALPGVVETRFFIPAYLTAYGIFAFGALDHPSAYFSKFRSPKLWIAFVLIIWFAFTLSATTLQTMQPICPFFGGL